MESQGPPPPPDGPRPFPLCERQRRGSGETEEPASRYGLGVTEFPGRPGGCERQGRTTPAGAVAQRPARATVTGAEPTGPGRLGGASRKRGPWVPLCEGRRRGAGQPPAAGSLDACPPAGAPVGPAASPPHFPSGGASRLPPPSSGLLRARPFPTPPAWASVPIGRALPSHPHPPRHFALSPPPPLTSSSSPVGPWAPLHSPPGFADFRPPSAAPQRAGCYFSLSLVGVGEGETQ